MKYQPWGSKIFLLTTFLFLVASFGVNAQTASLEFETLNVALWPEYDRFEVLVLYRARLNPNISLPAQLTFRLPGHIKEMHAVAEETSGRLLNIDPALIDMRYEADDLILSFPTSSPNIHFEYYDPVILTKQNQNRVLAFTFTAPAKVKTANIEVQQPFEAKAFSLVPKADKIIVGANGLTYNTIQATNLTAGEIFELSANYQRDTNTLTTQAVQNNISEGIANITSSAELSNNTSSYVGYGLIGLGGLLLLGMGSYLWVKRNKAKSISPRRVAQKSKHRQTRRQKEQKRDKKQALTTKQAVAAFCYRCGIAFQDGANFCHACGAKRRVN